MKKPNSIFKTKLNELNDFILRVWKIMGKSEMAILPGQLAFFVILSLVPIITLIGYGATYFGVSMDSIISLLNANFSKNIVDMIVPIVSGQTIDLQLLIMFCMMFYIASNGADSVIVASNEIYNIKQSGWIKRRIKAILLTLVIVALVMFVLLVPAFGAKIIDTVDYFNVKSTIANMLEILQGPISWLIMFMFIKVIYSIAPDKPLPAAGVNFGAVFTTIGWVIATWIYSYWITNFARYDIFYAGLSNIAVLMLWIYFLSYIFVIGMSLNYQAHEAELEITGSLKKYK